MHISSDDNRLQYCGRIDFDDPKAPVFVYAASFVQKHCSKTCKSPCVLVEPNGIYIRWTTGSILARFGSGAVYLCDSR